MSEVVSSLLMCLASLHSFALFQGCWCWTQDCLWAVHSKCIRVTHLSTVCISDKGTKHNLYYLEFMENILHTTKGDDIQDNDFMRRHTLFIAFPMKTSCFSVCNIPDITNRWSMTSVGNQWVISWLVIDHRWWLMSNWSGKILWPIDYSSMTLITYSSLLIDDPSITHRLLYCTWYGEQNSPSEA